MLIVLWVSVAVKSRYTHCVLVDPRLSEVIAVPLVESNLNVLVPIDGGVTSDFTIVTVMLAVDVFPAASPIVTVNV